VEYLRMHKGGCPMTRQQREYKKEQEYIITEYQLVRTESKEIRDAVRSRPHTPAPAEQQDSAFDLLWKGCADLRSNESGDALCAMYGECCFPNCYIAGSHVRRPPKEIVEHDAAVARTATLVENRRVLQEQYDWWLHNWKRLDAVRDYMNLLKESLRAAGEQE
jgi:hypothetical protein